MTFFVVTHFLSDLPAKFTYYILSYILYIVTYFFPSLRLIGVRERPLGAPGSSGPLDFVQVRQVVVTPLCGESKYE